MKGHARGHHYPVQLTVHTVPYMFLKNQDCVDESSGDTYFYRESTGEVVWEARETWPEQPCGIGWVKDFDEASGNTYYFNECSGESVWDVEKTWDELKQGEQFSLELKPRIS